MEYTLKRSRVCLAGRFNAKKGLTPEDLNPTDWKRITMSKSDYEAMKGHYFQSFLRSMLEVADVEKQVVCRYEMVFPKQFDQLMALVAEAGTQTSYPCKINNIRLWFFPYDMVLFSIDIEEFPESFSNLTLMHRKWKAWQSNYNEFHTKELDEMLRPLAQLTPSQCPSQITYSGTKIRQYQAIEIDITNGDSETVTIKDDLLYELGTFSDIGIVEDKDPKKSFKPSTDYYNQIIRENTLSVFSNWKALALNDSFTVLTIDDFFIKKEFEENFELLYMRCLFEEFYCFDRNNLYREKKETDIDSKGIETEISYMEQHYFYDEFCFDFNTPLMYQAMAKGLELQKDREQLTQHVKQALRDARQERNNSAVNFVQIFAVFSVIWTIHAMLIDGTCSAFFSLLVALLITALLLKRPQLLTRLLQNN